MEEGLSKVDAWRLVNVIFRMYKVIANCCDLCRLYTDQKVILLEEWEEKDKEIANYYQNPQHYEYGRDATIQLSDRTFEELFNFIIEQDDFALAMDFIQPKLHLNHLIQTMQKIKEHKGIRFSSIDFIVSLRDFRVEIYKWSAVYSSRINSTIDAEMEKRKVMTYSLLCDEKSGKSIMKEDSENYKAVENNSFDLSGFFVDVYNPVCISRIYQYLKLLNTQKGASYLAKMASVIAIAWENNLLSDTYNNTLQAVFKHFGISDKINNYKPSRLRRCNYKGTIPLARAQAIKFFHSIENRTGIY